MIKDQNISFLEWHLDAGADALLEEKAQNSLKNSSNAQVKVNRNQENNDFVKEEINYPNIKEYNNLEELKIAIQSFDRCNIKKTAKNLVFGSGKVGSKLMLIGEAPGEEEDISGEPFVGAAGKLLSKMLNSIVINRSETYITNIIPWRPPGNRKPSIEEIEAFKPFVYRHIELVYPKILVLVGGSAASAILQNDLGITRLRGKWFKFQEIDTLPIFHPAYLLRQPSQKKQAWEDLLKIKDKIEKLQ